MFKEEGISKEPLPSNTTKATYKVLVGEDCRGSCKNGAPSISRFRSSDIRQNHKFLQLPDQSSHIANLARALDHLSRIGSLVLSFLESLWNS